MLKTENILVREKVKNLRQLLKEYVSRTDIVSAINNREIIKILYKGSDTKNVGWRTVEPYVLGTSKAGNIVLRGWQQAGDSDGFSGVGRIPRQNHERWKDYHNITGEVPGWRMFRLDGIKQIVFTNKQMDLDKVPPDYKPSEPAGEITGIIASALPVDKDAVTQKGIGRVRADIDPNASVFDKQTNSWKLIPRDEKYQQLQLKNSIKNAVSFVSQKQKEALKNWMLVNVNGRNIPVRENPTNQRKFDKNIVGNLEKLYRENFGSPTIDRSQFLKNRRDFENELQKSLKDRKQPEI